jgi:hypothetical protein
VERKVFVVPACERGRYNVVDNGVTLGTIHSGVEWARNPERGDKLAVLEYRADLIVEQSSNKGEYELVINFPFVEDLLNIRG